MNENEIRDMFAGDALGPIIARTGLNRNNPGMIAQEAYLVADAMMAERAKRIQ
ncbi:protein of unknown function [Bradyrhizobium sp. ORS 285]|uniref:hypothetical protein n=1 Tax=Bradyrhizobium sp. ORS 285 TaxID=115808 RepID=UPI00024095B0|nr:hypothetical protein [Bradyrhizobium sp. ORS 285]CCD89876.1 hypothetical protein BRAO285_850082 [Bradyrhizobium sp. ORS 285]SMX61499.1 protein of unknown function [Bradyrhizobium sp. ORS 285]